MFGNYKYFSKASPWSVKKELMIDDESREETKGQSTVSY